MDDKHVYFREHTIKYADPKTFEVLTAGYARDRLHVFIRDRAFKADPKTFFILQDLTPKTVITCIEMVLLLMM